LEDRIIRERIPQIICGNCQQVSLLEQINALTALRNDFIQEIQREKEHVEILDAKADECLVPELIPPGVTPNC
jgi:hypothetical protein